MGDDIEEVGEPNENSAGGPRSAPPILLLGSFYTGNLGDQAILDSEKRLFDHWGANTLTGSFKPGRFRGDNEDGRPLSVIRNLLFDIPVSLAQLFLRARRSGTVVIGGGSLLQDNSWVSPFLAALTCLVIRLAGAQLHFLAVGSGEFRLGSSAWIYSRCFRLARTASVRDTRTQRVLGQFVTADALDLVADPAFVTPPISAPKRWAVGLSLRPFRHPDFDEQPDPAQYEAFLGRIERLIGRLLDRYSDRRLLLFTSELPHDSEVLADLERRGTVELSSLDVATPQTVRELVTCVASCSQIIGTRLHPCILALSQNVPAFALDYDGKIERFLATLGASHRVLATVDGELDLTQLDRDSGPEDALMSSRIESLKAGLRSQISAICATHQASSR